jgi:hypothetical protein
MAKKLYTGFEGYWANKTSDQIIQGSSIADFWPPLKFVSNNANDIVVNFDASARTLTGARGSYIKLVEGVNSSLKLMTGQAAYATGFALNFFFKFDSLPATGTTNIYIFSDRNSPQGGVYSSAIRYDHSPAGTSILSVGGSTYGANVNLPAALSAGVWYYCSFKVVPGVSMYANLNGTEVTYTGAFASNVDLIFNTVTSSGSPITRYIDDLCLNDLTGGADNDLPPAARFFNATLNATDGALSGWVCSPTGPTPQAALRDGLDTNAVVSQSSGQVVGEVLPDVSALYPSANRVLTMNFAMKNVVRDSVSAPSLSTRVNSGTNTDTVVGPGLATGNYFVPTFYKTGVTEFTVAEYNAAEAQLVST